MTAIVVALGASNTEGYGVGADRAYPAALERLLRERGVAVRVLNAGVSGNTTAQMLARLEHAVPAGTRVVLLQPSSNDERLGVPASDRQRNIDEITGRLARRGIAVLRVATAFEAVRGENTQADGIHFTAAGHELIARLLVEQVAAALTN